MANLHFSCKKPQQLWSSPFSQVNVTQSIQIHLLVVKLKNWIFEPKIRFCPSLVSTGSLEKSAHAKNLFYFFERLLFLWVLEGTERVIGRRFLTTLPNSTWHQKPDLLEQQPLDNFMASHCDQTLFWVQKYSIFIKSHQILKILKAEKPVFCQNWIFPTKITFCITVLC